MFDRARALRQAQDKPCEGFSIAVRLFQKLPSQGCILEEDSFSI